MDHSDLFDASGARTDSGDAKCDSFGARRNAKPPKTALFLGNGDLTLSLHHIEIRMNIHK